VDAGAAKRAVHLHAHRVETELRGSDRGDVSAWATADDGDVDGHGFRHDPQLSRRKFRNVTLWLRNPPLGAGLAKRASVIQCETTLQQYPADPMPGARPGAREFTDSMGIRWCVWEQSIRQPELGLGRPIGKSAYRLFLYFESVN